ncbi:MAG TPA: cell wall hydrolase [Sphingobium sp.]|uniref:cell wall hydrolase n=1 Tax=Sphingobium sp. TaxID=1912891 RepID=UPI002ED449B1
MASLSPLPRHIAPAWRRRLPSSRWGWAVAALLLVLALRLLPAEALQALDGTSDGMAQQSPVNARNPSEDPGTTFPGSAYFFAQDAFAPVNAAPRPGDDPAVTTLAPGQNSPHILQIERGPVPLSMAMRGITSLDDARALQCMTNALYYEAGNEPEEGQRAVAQVILNRLASGRWPNSICAVVYQGGERADRGCQFTFSCDGSMARIPNVTAWIRARRIAARALGGDVFAPAGLATFYHTLAVRPPWVDRVRPVAVVGAHIFYRLPGEAGAPATYRMRYSGREFAQPGPYAFSAPPLPLPAPPGPEMLANWAMPIPTSAAPSSLPSIAGNVPVSPLGTPSAENPTTARDPASPALPQSTVRPEYRNSGRPLP